jgi:hypothetical protein
MAEDASNIQQNVLAVRRVEGDLDHDSPVSSGLSKSFNLNLGGNEEQLNPTPNSYPEPKYDRPPYPEQRRDQGPRDTIPNYSTYPEQRREQPANYNVPSQYNYPEPRRDQSPRDHRRDERGTTPQSRANEGQRFGNSQNGGNQFNRNQVAPNTPNANLNYSSNTPGPTGDCSQNGGN